MTITALNSNPVVNVDQFYGFMDLQDNQSS